MKIEATTLGGNDKEYRLLLEAESIKDVSTLAILGAIIKKPVVTRGMLKGNPTPYLWINIPVRQEKYSDLEIGNGY